MNITLGSMWQGLASCPSYLRLPLYILSITGLIIAPTVVCWLPTFFVQAPFSIILGFLLLLLIATLKSRPIYKSIKADETELEVLLQLLSLVISLFVGIWFSTSAPF
ncbi:hypothetical protein [Rubritalea sp.]|uniref:hypothetical protein n=1 Tax=Rubritalea sp. TaxID=2109375 RepID=UPI003EF5E8AD